MRVKQNNIVWYNESEQFTFHVRIPNTVNNKEKNIKLLNQFYSKNIKTCVGEYNYNGRKYYLTNCRDGDCFIMQSYAEEVVIREQ